MEKKPIIATELLKGQGLGNQLFCYVTTRALAYKKGFDFAILGRDPPDWARSGICNALDVPFR